MINDVVKILQEVKIYDDIDFLREFMKINQRLGIKGQRQLHQKVISGILEEIGKRTLDYSSEEMYHVLLLTERPKWFIEAWHPFVISDLNRIGVHTIKEFIFAVMNINDALAHEDMDKLDIILIINIMKVISEVYDESGLTDKFYERTTVMNEIGMGVEDELESSDSEEELPQAKWRNIPIGKPIIKKAADELKDIRNQLWRRGSKGFNERENFENYDEMVEEMTSSVIKLRKENEEDDMAWEKIQLGKAIEAVGLCLFRCRSAEESKQFVQWMQRSLARKFIITRREFMMYYTMINRHYTGPLGDVTGEMVKQGIMTQIIGHIDKEQLPELYNLILTVGKSSGKRNLFAWTNSVMDKLGDIGIDDIIQLAYKACELSAMMREVNLEGFDGIMQREISREIARISVFRNAPTILVDWWGEKTDLETSGSSVTTVGMRNLTLQELISQAEERFELKYISDPYGLMRTPKEFLEYVQLMMARYNLDPLNQESDSDDDSMPDLLLPGQELEREELIPEEERVYSYKPIIRCQFCKKELMYLSHGS